MTEHHSQEALNSQDYPHCRQAALCSIDAIFSKWCNSCKGSPRTFNLWAQAILKSVSRYLMSLNCQPSHYLHQPTTHTSHSFLSFIFQERDRFYMWKENLYLYVCQQTHLPCSAYDKKVTQHCTEIFWPLGFPLKYKSAWLSCWIFVKTLKSPQS